MLDDNFILQSDAAVIAGLLILLTVIFSIARRSQFEVQGEIAEVSVVKISRVAIFVIVLFCASAILVVLGNIVAPFTMTVPNFNLHLNRNAVTSVTLYPNVLSTLGKYAMIIGFSALAIGISWIVWSEATREWVRIQRG